MNPIAKRILTGLTIGALVVTAILLAPPASIVPVVAVLALLAILEYAALLRRKLEPFSPAFLLAFAAGALVLSAGLSALPAVATLHGNIFLLYVVAIIKLSDVGGFAFGMTSAKLIKGGNHKLCPKISPGKSWEGLFGSVVFSCAASCGFIVATGYTVPKALAFGLVAAFIGTAGDLVESKFKRWVGVKDSSTFRITHGMGGLLDMFDSLLFVPAVLLPFI